MSDLPTGGGAPQPVIIEVDTPKVDATLDLVEILQSVAGNAQTTATTVGKGVGAARLPANADVHLTAISDLATQLAARLATVRHDMPSVHAAIERAAANKPA